MDEAMERARTQLRQRAHELLGKHHVVATGLGYKTVQGQRTQTPSIVCSVDRKLPVEALLPEELVPASLDGVPTDVIETGPIRALAAPTERFRPAPGGVSVGHKDITAGTLGCWVRRNGEWMLLSNNHVLANSNAASRGDAILQPGPYDGGRNPEDQLAELEDFVPIAMLGLPSDCSIASGVAAVLNGLAALVDSDTRLQPVRARAAANRVDAAIARPLRGVDVDAEILHIGPIAGTRSAELGMAVKKMGRTTGLTEGEITQVDVTVNVQYGAGRLARFEDQLMAGPMSQGGDSGSAVLDADDHLVGLLFAGSEQSTIMNRIEHVFSALDLSL